MKKTKLPGLKSLHNKLWILTKLKVRSLYSWETCYICKENITEPKKSHTGHLFKIGTLPLQHKYDLRLLRPCCVTCNLWRDGNEARYVIEILREVGFQALMSLVNDIETTKDIEGTAERREWYLSAIHRLEIDRKNNKW